MRRGTSSRPCTACTSPSRTAGWRPPATRTCHCFLRSSSKPIQAMPLARRAATTSADDELAIACASHHAEPAQLEAVRKLLARAGAGVDDLECGAQEGRPEGPLGHNCSGQARRHARRLPRARAGPWHTGYRRTRCSTPLQQRRRRAASGRPMTRDRRLRRADVRDCRSAGASRALLDARRRPPIAAAMRAPPGARRRRARRGRHRSDARAARLDGEGRRRGAPLRARPPTASASRSRSRTESTRALRPALGQVLGVDDPSGRSTVRNTPRRGRRLDRA